MKVQALQTWADFDALSDAWNGLLQRSNASTIFLTWEWIDAWRRAIDDAVAPYVVVVRRDDGELAGVAPLYVASVKIWHTASFRLLRYMADTATGAEYPDWIVDANDEAEICDAISDHIHSHREDWDAIWLKAVSGWAGAEERILASAKRRSLFTRHRPSEFTFVDLPSEMEEFENRFSAKSRQQIRRTTRRVLDLDGITIERCIRQEEIGEYLGALFELHQMRWEATGIDGCFRRKPAEQAFYEEMVPIALQNDWLWLFALKKDNVIKAVQLGYVFDDVYVQLQEGYDPLFQPGVGNALRHHVIDQCMQAGLSGYDFLAGLSEHKRRWGGVIRDGFEVMIGNSTLRSRLLLSTGMWPTGRHMQEHGLVTGANDL